MNPNNTPYTSSQLIKEEQHQGYSVLTSKGDLAQVQMDAAISVIKGFVQWHSRTLAIRVDLRYPSSYSLEAQCCRGAMRSFFESLKSQIAAERQRATKKSIIHRAHDTKIGYIWAREYGQQSHRPHFHVVILLNRDTYRALGKTDIQCDNLYSRIVKSWARTLGIRAEEAVGLVHIPNNAIYRVNENEPEIMDELITRTSYLCKLETKKFNNGERTFGTSRVLKI